MKKFFSANWLILVTGVVIGAAALVLTHMGNPGNMGFCIACFLRDTSGAMKLHSAGVVQYVRPEIVGIILGAAIMAIVKGEFRGRSGSSPMVRFILGVFVMIGALVFLGCPLRMVIRIGGGDLNAIVALLGFIVGIAVGVVFLKKGFSLPRSYKQNIAEGAAFPVAYLFIFVLSIVAAALFASSTEGPGSMRAPVAAALIAGLVVGALCQRSRMCMVGGIRNSILFKDFGLVAGFLMIIITILIGNACMGKLNFSFTGQPVAHNDHLWNFMGMALVGWGSVLLGGCPLRQLVLAGGGDGDAGITVVGLMAGAAISHNWGLAGAAGLVADGKGASTNAQIAVIIGLVVSLIISVMYTRRNSK